jgi:signal transduction histidine kinase
MRIEFSQRGFPADLPRDVSLCIFRIAQETLRNCLKHSGASTARVALVNSGKKVRLSVSDDGCGFDLQSDAMNKGLGFISIRERLKLVGGYVEVHSEPTQGTVIKVTAPLSREIETGHS